MKCKMCEVLQPFRKGRKPLACVGCGELGVCAQLREPQYQQHSSPAGPARGILVALGAACRQDMDPVGLCPFPRRSVLWRAPGTRAQLVSQLCHRSVFQDESESLWAEPSPCGVTALPALPALLPSWGLGAHGTPRAAWPCPSQPRGPPQLGAGGEGLSSPAPEHNGRNELNQPGLCGVNQGHVWKQGSP